MRSPMILCILALCIAAFFLLSVLMLCFVQTMNLINEQTTHERYGSKKYLRTRVETDPSQMYDPIEGKTHSEFSNFDSSVYFKDTATLP
mmetsp:Transcript_34702/g.53224  ORF Transcript_34702/g.53224 Transcript_34702/m.53224 type:complete len:89 (-) Transcript_34702:259-525(-)